VLAEPLAEKVGLRLAEPVKVTLLVPVLLLLWHTEAVKLELTVLQLDTLLDRLGVLLGQLLELPLMVCATEVAPGDTLMVALEQTLLEMELVKEEEKEALPLMPALAL
jgi:hypothetical protein